MIGLAQKLEVELLSKKKSFWISYVTSPEDWKSFWITGFTNAQGFLTAIRQEVILRHPFFFVSMFLFVKFKNHGFEWLLLHLLTHTFTPLFVGLLLYIYIYVYLTI